MTQDNAARIKDVRKAEKASARFELERVEGLRHLCSTYPGRLWLWRQMEEANVFSQTFTGEALTTAFNEGQRARGLAILSDLMLHAPDTFLKMMVEHNERSSTSSALADRDTQRATGGHPVSPASPDSIGSGTGTGDTQPDFDFDLIGSA